MLPPRLVLTSPALRGPWTGGATRKDFMPRLKIGIAGAGAMGRLHADHLLRDERVQIVAIAEPDAHKAREFADRLDARPCADMEQLISSGVDAVIIATPNVSHADL